jgi:YidC/Oxa1 family membrane protein insertase
MEKKTILAIALSVVVITGFYLIQAKLYPKNNVIPQNPATSEQVQQQNNPAVPRETGPVTPTGVTTPTETPSPTGVTTPTGGLTSPTASAGQTAGLEEFPATEQLVSIETPLLQIDLSNSGGDIVSFRLKEHKESSEYVDMILAGTDPAHAFGIAFGGKDAKPISSFFAVRRISDYSVEFYRDFLTNSDAGQTAAPQLFRLTKRYNFKPDEYMFELIVSLDGGNAIPALNFTSSTGSAAAYTLEFGPQIGPPFEKLDDRYDYRHYITFINGKQKNQKVTDKQDFVSNARFAWAAIAGKYFTLIAVPDATQYELVFSSQPPAAGVASASRLAMVRPPLNASRVSDTYRFYMGPKTQKQLARYDNGANGFGYTDMRMETVANASGFWGILNPLERLLNWLLGIFYLLVHNYGIAIILVTFLVKLVLFPLTKKSSEGTLRMQAIAPKIKEVQEKYKENPQKMNMEMAALYKKEGYSPLSGCLPMLIQIPIFLAMYNLFNNHFELRGAMFIPGWIPDLSLPETIWNFAPFRVPFLGWSDLRLLPFIYVGSQLLYGKITQTPDTAGNAQMKMMLYAMPVVFFFILYNVPSGLLIYWIMSNILTMFQQLMINKIMAKKKAELAANAVPEKKLIVPPKKRRKK